MPFHPFQPCNGGSPRLSLERLAHREPFHPFQLASPSALWTLPGMVASARGGNPANATGPAMATHRQRRPARLHERDKGADG